MATANTNSMEKNPGGRRRSVLRQADTHRQLQMKRGLRAADAEEARDAGVLHFALTIELAAVAAERGWEREFGNLRIHPAYFIVGITNSALPPPPFFSSEDWGQRLVTVLSRV